MSKFWWAVYGAVVVVAAASVVVPRAFGGEFNFGLGINTDASSRDVGLPFYPGAKQHRDGKDDESSARINGAFGGFGLKIAAVKLDSNDPVDRIAPFYRDALRKYGPILDCSAGRPYPPKADKKSDRLDCGDDHPKPGDVVLKAGVKKNFHVVAIERDGRGSIINLVAIEMRGVD
jgi:hypothetical protein